MGVALLLSGADFEGVRAHSASADTRPAVAAEKTTLPARIFSLLHTHCCFRRRFSRDMVGQQHDPLSDLCNQSPCAACARDHDSSAVMAVDVCVPCPGDGMGCDAPECPRCGCGADSPCDSDVALY